MPDPFSGQAGGWEHEGLRPIVPTPANMAGPLRGRRVLIGLPGMGWRADLRADEKVVQGSRTYVPVMSESEWYRAEAEQTEVFAPMVPVERVWAEEYGLAGTAVLPSDMISRLVSLDGPPRRSPVSALDADVITGRRVVQILDNGHERRDLRGVTEVHSGDEGDVCVRVTTELDWYRWGWTGRAPSTLEVPVNTLWVE
ncbi:hypothetical protein [Actinoplanes sp. NBRC 103695]|uniref:hypothetical protein n=1 Tax=Actinoplanes sp. NBRC 103695 TaxID=3032202 RepID=UPI0024A3CF5C|nr:hypothetical protein [Actinoplanes sp. NBRC 103695]GLY97068.1 hypothetical protein Acsp02_43220 [Actinoplanes sp. NBRC 103695]